MSTRNDHIQHQSSYRKGVVLGLTFAEMLLLLVFCLVLAIGFSIRDRDQLAEELASNTVREEQLAELQSELNRLKNQEQIQQAQSTLTPDQITQNAAVLEAIKENNPELYEQILYLVSESDTPLEEPIIIPQNDYQRLVSAEQNYETINVNGLADRLANAPEDELRQFERAFSEASETQSLPEIEFAQNQGQSAPHDWPPIISLSDKDNFRFETGSAVMSESFKADLREVALPELLAIIDEYDVDVVEVYGHTDEQPVSGGRSNLDTQLTEFYADEAGISSLNASDNAGLGLARAVSVAHELESFEELAGITILPYSGGQLITPSGQVSTGAYQDAPERRRIEIRVRRSETPSAENSSES